MIIRQYSEVANPESISSSDRDTISFENTTAELATITSTFNDHSELGLTEASQKQRSIPVDIVNYTLDRLAEKGI